MPNTQEEALKEIADLLNEELSDIDFSKVSKKVQKSFEKLINNMSIQLDKLGTTTMQRFQSIVGNLESMGIPFADAVGQSAGKVKNLQGLLKNLGESGFPKLGKAATNLSGTAGIAATGVAVLGKAVLDLTIMFAKAREEIARTSASVGVAHNLLATTRESFKIASEIAIKYSMGIEDVTKQMQAAASAGIDPTNKGMMAVIENFTKLQLGLGVTAGTSSSVLKLLRQEYGIKKGLLERTLALTAGREKLKMTTEDYLKTVVGLTRGFIDFGIGAYTTSIQLKDAASTLELGATRAKKYTQEMIGGPRGAGMGQRAWLAEQMGIGTGIGGAARLSYGADTSANLGKGLIDVAQRELGLGDVRAMKGQEQWGAAGQIAMFAKQFGISERTVYEELGLPIKKQIEPLESMAKETAKMSGTMEKNLEEISKARHFLEVEFWSKLKGVWYEFAAKGFGSQIKELARPILGNLFLSKAEAARLIQPQKKHTGGDIKLPSFQMGGEVPILAKANEYIIREESVTPATKPLLENINQYGERGMGTGGGSLNVEVNLPILQPYIQEAINNALRENPNLLMFG